MMLSEDQLLTYYETLHVLTQQAGRYTLTEIENSTPFEVEVYSHFLNAMYERRKQALEEQKNRG